MKTHVVVRYRVTDEAAYAQYRELAGPTHIPFGGQLVLKGTEVEQLENGDELTNVAVLEFPDAGAARSWYSSTNYQRAKTVRDEAGPMSLSVIEG